MLGWAFIAYERWLRADIARATRHLPRVTPGLLRRFGEAKLARTLRRVWDRSPAQRERWRSLGVRRRQLAWPETLERLPFITGDDIAERPGDFLCAPAAELIHVLSTSGTKGRCKSIYLTEDDLVGQLGAIGLAYRRLPGASRGLAVFDVTCPTWSAGLIARRGFEAARMFGLLSATCADTPAQLDLIRDYRIDLLVTTPTVAHRLTREADRDLRSLGLRWMLLSGQPWPETLRDELESAWGARALDVYASTEFVCGLASECPERSGLHLSEPDHWAEVVEPGTGRVLAEGEEGELVVTTLSRRGMPLVRYRTGDFARLLPREGRCACGSPLRRISRIRGRVDDMVILGSGNNVYPDEFDRALFALPGVTDFRIVLEKEDGWQDVLRATVEASPGAAVSREAVEAALLGIPHVAHSHADERTLRLGRVDIVASGALSAGRPKTDRIVDRRVPD